MAISSQSLSLALQNLSISPNETVSSNQFAAQSVDFQFRLLGSSENSTFSSFSIRNDVSLRENNRSNSCQVFQLKCSESDFVAKTSAVSEVIEEPRIDDGSGGDGGKGRVPSGGGGGGGGDEEEEGDFDENEFGPILKFEEVMREAEKRGATLPSDMLEAAETTGIRSLILSRYLGLQVEMPAYDV